MKFRYPRLARVNPRMGAKFRLRPGLWAVCRRRVGRAGQLCQCKRLRAFASSYERLRAVTSSYEQLRLRASFTSVCEQLRAFASSYERLRVTSVYEQLRAFASSYDVCDERLRAVTSVCEQLRAFASSYERLRAVTSVCEQLRAFTSSYERLRAVRAFTSSYERLRVFTSVRLRAFTSSYERLRALCRVRSRQILFFACSGTFGRVVFFRLFSSFFVILRHSSSQMVFSGMAGKGRLRHWLGKEGSSLLRIVLAPGAGRKK